SLVAVLELFREARGASLSTPCQGRGRGVPCRLEKHSRCPHRLQGRWIGMVRRRWLVATVLVVVALIAVGCQRPQAQQPAARAKTMDFSDAYMDVGQVVLVRADETRINGVDDLADKSVAVQRGTTNAEAATNFQKQKKVKTVKQFPTFDLAVKSLLNKEVDAVIIDNT